MKYCLHLLMLMQLQIQIAQFLLLIKHNLNQTQHNLLHQIKLLDKTQGIVLRLFQIQLLLLHLRKLLAQIQFYLLQILVYLQIQVVHYHQLLSQNNRLNQE